MKVSLPCALVAGIARAAYTGDIVQYWVDQSAILVNGTVIGGLQSPPSGWFEAIVQAAVYLAATETQEDSLEVQQLAVSHAAHDALVWTFHGTRLYASIDARLKALLEPIGLNPDSEEAQRATEIGREAAVTVTAARNDDGINHFVDYTVQPPVPGVYQPTPGGAAIPDTPQAQFIRLFGGLGDVTRFRAPPPPDVNSTEYEEFVVFVRDQGGRNSTERTPYDTETAYYWREASPIGWNRFAHAVIGNSLAEDVLASARFYAQLNYALANAAIASWDSKYYYNAWRPVTAIRRTDIWLPSGNNVSDPAWTPLLATTPNHPDYLSTHATFGGAAGAVITAWNGGDEIDIYHSSNVTLDNVGVVTRHYTSIAHAVQENGDSRFYGGVHFQFASDVGSEIGDWVGRETLANFDEHWSEY